jgi:hypothetical protein
MLALACAIVVSLSIDCLAQDTDAIGIKCAQSKLKAAGKECACVHKAWNSALAKGGIPDFSACEDKVIAAFAKAEQQASAAGGICLAGESATAVTEAIVAAADKTVSQVGRGVITPAPDACDGISKLVAYAGGSYSKLPKCVTPDPGKTCDSGSTGRKLSNAISKELKCPGCPDGEEGCDPRVPTILPEDTEARGDACCLRSDANDASKSVEFSAKCTVCISG